MARPPLDLLHRRMIRIPLVAWLALLALSMIEGPGVALRFLHDLEAHVRFLVALPLLVLAERAVHERIRPLVGQFLRGSRRPSRYRERAARRPRA